jgi:predicted Fe-Mo cluster-binding NifX family protein
VKVPANLALEKDMVWIKQNETILKKRSVDMKICVTSQGNSLDSQVDPRFGRCKYFIIVNPESLEFEAIENSSLSITGGAGIQSGQLVASKDVKAVLTGNVGPNAFQTLQAAGIDVITGVTGSIKEVIEKYKKGELKTTQGPSVDRKFGIGGK